MWGKLIGYFFLSMVKFLFTPSAMFLDPTEDYSFFTIVLTTSSGAAVGVLVTYGFGKRLFVYLSMRAKRRGAKVFSASRRRIVRIKNKYGIFGLMLISGLISVPITSLIASKYFNHKKETPFLLILAFFAWSILLTGVHFIFKNAVNAG